MVKLLHSKHRTLSSTPRTAKKQKQKQKKPTYETKKKEGPQRFEKAGRMLDLKIGPFHVTITFLFLFYILFLNLVFIGCIFLHFFYYCTG
jgi:hypothetical protein